MSGTQVVVDVANSPSFEDKAVLEFFKTSGRNLLAAEAAAGVVHHVALSVVGADRLPESGYLRAKVAQEALIKASKIPFTILRSTQFFEFVGAITQSATMGKDVHLSPALLQPVASDDVAAALADLTVGKPINGFVEIAGPEKIPLDEIGRRYLSAKSDARRVIADVHARYFGTELNDKSLTPGDKPIFGKNRIDDWLRAQAASKCSNCRQSIAAGHQDDEIDLHRRRVNTGSHSARERRPHARGARELVFCCTRSDDDWAI
jgi:uncharacterized protein YbjT (DUF2867 family)